MVEQQVFLWLVQVFATLGAAWLAWRGAIMAMHRVTGRHIEDCRSDLSHGLVFLAYGLFPAGIAYLLTGTAWIIPLSLAAAVWVGFRFNGRA